MGGMIMCSPCDLVSLRLGMAIHPTSGFHLKCDGCEPMGWIGRDRSWLDHES